MTKTYKFYTSTNNNNSFPSNTNCSKVIDDLILTDIIKKNSYLFNKETDKVLDALFEKPTSDKFINATNFLANYKKYNSHCKFPFIIGKMYTLSDGTPIVFYDDEIQIGFDVYKYSKFNDFSFLKNLTPNIKKTIINIYTTGTANININII